MRRLAPRIGVAFSFCVASVCQAGTLASATWTQEVAVYPAGAPPFVDVGASVEPDTVIGIIEVMKLMNAVRAGTRGVVREIRARDGTLVEYGETLLLVDAREAH